MKIDLSSFTDAELSRLIVNASQELHDRLSDTPLVKRVAGAQRPVITVQEPDYEDKQFALHIVSILRTGCYIKAGERRRVAEIAAKYPAWVRQQGLPLVAGTAAWRHAAKFNGTYKPAREQ